MLDAITRPHLALLLFALWVLLSGKIDAFHLSAGALASLGVAATTHRLWLLPPAFGGSARRPFEGVRWGRLLLFLLWLAWEVVISAVQVAYVSLHPRLPIGPRLVRFRAHLPHTLSRLALANSITLTPGTVTLEVADDEFVVHALTDASARSIEFGAMRNRVSRLFTRHERPVFRRGEA